MTIRNYTTLKLIDKKQTSKEQLKYRCKTLLKRSKLFLIRLLDQCYPPNSIKLRLVYTNGKPAINVGGISNSYNTKKYRTNASGFIRIYLTRKRDYSRRSYRAYSTKKRRKRRKFYKTRHTIIYINGIRATKLLNASRATQVITVTYADSKNKVFPARPYTPKHTPILQRIKPIWKRMKWLVWQ